MSLYQLSRLAHSLHHTAGQQKLRTIMTGMQRAIEYGGTETLGPYPHVPLTQSP